MIYSAVVNLEAEHDAEMTSYLGYHALALFLGLIRRVDEQLAERLHSMQGLKPFTVSPLQGKYTYRKSGIFIRKGAPCWLRFTALEEAIFARLMDSFIKGEQHLQLEQADFRVADVITHPQGSQWAGFASFDEMLERASGERKVSLRFDSPTVFRSGGKRNIAFPSPELVFGSLLNKWNAFSGIELNPSLVDDVGSEVLVSRYKLETKMLAFNSYQELGFLGSCVYSANDDVTGDELRTLNALADFAFFCGTGVKTTMGMGQTRKLKTVIKQRR